MKNVHINFRHELDETQTNLLAELIKNAPKDKIKLSRKHNFIVEYKGEFFTITLSHSLLRYKSLNFPNEPRYRVLGSKEDSLGSGQFGKVKRVKQKVKLANNVLSIKESKTKYVIKTIKLGGKDVTEDTYFRNLSDYLKEHKVTSLFYKTKLQAFTDNKKNGNKAFLIMEEIPGISLDKLIEENNFKQVSFIDRIEICIAILKAIKKCSDRGIIHRDIKPSNIKYDFQTKKAYLLDFGGAKKKGEEDDFCYGARLYIPPEEINAESSEKSMVFSIAGVIGNLLNAENIGKYRIQGKIDLEHPLSLEENSYNFDELCTNIEIDAKTKNHLKSLLEKMSSVSYKPRMSIEEALQKFIELHPNESIKQQLVKKLEDEIATLSRFSFFMDNGGERKRILQKLLIAIDEPRNFDLSFHDVLKRSFDDNSIDTIFVSDNIIHIANFKFLSQLHDEFGSEILNRSLQIQSDNDMAAHQDTLTYDIQPLPSRFLPAS